MRPYHELGGGAGHSIRVINGPLELRGIADGNRIPHASVMNHQGVAA
jgi:hypothetical protein